VRLPELVGPFDPAAIRLAGGNAYGSLRASLLQDDEPDDRRRDHTDDSPSNQVSSARPSFGLALASLLGQPPLLFLLEFLAHGARGYQGRIKKVFKLGAGRGRGR
jgi:hypothetical protein